MSIKTKTKQLLYTIRRKMQKPLLIIALGMLLGVILVWIYWSFSVTIHITNPIAPLLAAEERSFAVSEDEVLANIGGLKQEEGSTLNKLSRDPSPAGVLRDVTMYNVGVAWQTDSSPCTAANGENVCLALELGYKRCAANFVPFGTRLKIQNYGECIVTDRMNARFKNRVDIAAKADEIPRARAFGLQNLLVEVINPHAQTN
jgi:3D (Asp-Asp-Asp) domain-containing protein